MSVPDDTRVPVAIACGGTGGHFFPGLAVGEELRARGCDVHLLVSEKDVDQHAARAAIGMSVERVPAVALRGNVFRFAGRLRAAYRAARRDFQARPPAAVLAMGGFTSAAPVLAARRLGIPTFLHEANSIPGRANRWLAHVVDGAFVYFPEAAGRISHQQVRVTGMPVRAQFEPGDPEAARMALGLDPQRPVLLVMGGSQGAAAINEAMMTALPELSEDEPDLQFIHLTGPADGERVASAYRVQSRRAVVRAFLSEMELALGAATLAVTRAGASSLAEQAALRVPAVLIPYPHASDNHQLYNARAFAETGAARLFPAGDLNPGRLVREIRTLLGDESRRRGMQVALCQWHFADAARSIAEIILRRVRPAAACAGAGTVVRRACVHGLAPQPER